MDGESRQSHAGERLENGSLRHDGSPILQWRDWLGLDMGRLGGLEAGDFLLLHGELELWVERSLVVPVGFVPLVRDVAQDVGPRDAVGTADEPRMRHGPEAFTNVGGVRDVTVRGQQYRSDPGGVSGKTDIGLG